MLLASLQLPPNLLVSARLCHSRNLLVNSLLHDLQLCSVDAQRTTRHARNAKKRQARRTPESRRISTAEAALTEAAAPTEKQLLKIFANRIFASRSP
ncbi:hypothetical protein M011DRAFT_471038 [Sporormia fimetaria CBS 119925]|uniref:Uncharacterized protein n=1 Tax=Sporormia fimetaria CBS 119925 TaxID=1340428 RepID=A0A6A6V1L6_9PLEO|nr:hypothetical protein M011DRAFT_471038 [Sporormia fimetaria CBS 119925]